MLTNFLSAIWLLEAKFVSLARGQPHSPKIDYLVANVFGLMFPEAVQALSGVSTRNILIVIAVPTKPSFPIISLFNYKYLLPW